MDRFAENTYLRGNETFMSFWAAINVARKADGQPEALFANVRRLWADAREATVTERFVAIQRGA